MAFTRGVFVLAFVSFSWTSSPLAVQSDAAKALAAAEALWQSKKPASYRYTVDVVCFCMLARTPPTFRVVGDAPRAETDLGAGSQTYDHYNTVPKLFVLLKRYVEQKPIKLDVKYDAVYGFPTFIDLDGRTDIADDELRVTVTNFTPLSAPGR
jgi:hypothetical protein